MLYHVIFSFYWMAAHWWRFSDKATRFPSSQSSQRFRPERHIALFHAEGACQAPQAAVDVAACDLVLATRYHWCQSNFNGTMGIDDGFGAKMNDSWGVSSFFFMIHISNWNFIRYDIHWIDLNVIVKFMIRATRWNTWVWKNDGSCIIKFVGGCRFAP